VITTWRIVKLKYKGPDAFTGKGAAIRPGRWHSVGTCIVYTSENLPLAAREIKDLNPLPSTDWVFCSLDIPGDIVKEVDASNLPPEWNRPDWRLYMPVATQQIGDDFIQNGSAAVLRVPSAWSTSKTTLEHNYHLNPSHPDVAKITFHPFFPLHSSVLDEIADSPNESQKLKLLIKTLTAEKTR